MHIAFIEIANFRKLLSVRVDLAETTTLFVGANNSGKTSAMLALRRFLSPKAKGFETHDITLCHWPAINAIGDEWLEARANESIIELNADPWSSYLPCLDLWLQVEQDELHYVSSLIPTLDWEGGLLGVRMRLEPKDPKTLYKDFLEAMDAAAAIRAAAKAVDQEVKEGGSSSEPTELTIWPMNLVDFLERRINQQLVVRAYTLDPGRITPSVAGQARLQVLPPEFLPIEGDPLEGLIRVDEISAQRGFGGSQNSVNGESTPIKSGATRLSDQLRDYWKKHLDPSEQPDPSDLGALQAIQAAQDAFDERLTESFAAAFTEVEGLGYPGVTDPRPRVSTKLKAIDGLNHTAAVSFEVDVIAEDGATTPLLRLPEDNNGLGYQNLISMIFRLMSYRDAWMRVGKAAKDSSMVRTEPLHLVLVEEPEAHLHAQVQQVFIKKAYSVLRAHSNLGTNAKLKSQLVVSTHSSHVAHETSFACLRYFRRLPAGMAATVPVSTVINLAKVFGSESETKRFVTRYLRSQHAELFFADAIIMVEGPAERMLLPNFIRKHYRVLDQCYVSLLEIGGSHAHRLKDLIEHLGVLTLIITDLDALNGVTKSSEAPVRGASQVTNNATLKDWLPKLTGVDALFKANESAKIAIHDRLFAIRAAYQIPVEVKRPGSDKMETAYPYTFEDALAFENLEFFSKLDGFGLVNKFQDAIINEADICAIGEKLFKALQNGKKAEFALDVISAKDFETLKVPTYIAEGLSWLEGLLKKKQVEILPAETA